jgi:hypothetical protein
MMAKENTDFKKSWEENNSISSLWIGKSKEGQELLFRGQKGSFNSCIAGFKIWQEKHKGSSFNIYYDGNAATNAQVESTQEVLPGVTFKNIHDIPLVKENPDLFAEDIPIYWRIDILKLIIVLHEIEHEKRSATLFIDMPMAYKVEEGDFIKHQEDLTLLKGLIETGELFAQKHVEKLQKRAMLGSNRGENQIHQLVQNNVMQKAIQIYILGHFRSMRYLLSEIDLGGSILVDDEERSVNSFFDESFFERVNEVVFYHLDELYIMYLHMQGELKIIGLEDVLDSERLMQWYCPIGTIPKYNLSTESGQKKLVTLKPEYYMHAYNTHEYTYRDDIGRGGGTHPYTGFMSFTWLSDINVVENNLQKNGLLLARLPSDMQENKKLVLAAVSQNGKAIQYAAKTLQEDIDVQAAVEAKAATTIQAAFKGFLARKKVAKIKAGKQDLSDPTAIKTNPQVWKIILAYTLSAILLTLGITLFFVNLPIFASITATLSIISLCTAAYLTFKIPKVKLANHRATMPVMTQKPPAASNRDTSNTKGLSEQINFNIK